MTVRVDTGQRPGSSARPTRERIVVVEHAAVVLDGASSDDGFAGLLAGELAHCLQRPGDLPLAVQVADAIRAAVAHARRDGGSLMPGGTPSSTMLVCRWTGATVEVLVLGDGTALVSTRDGRAHRVSDERIATEQRVVIEGHRAGGDRAAEDDTRLTSELPAAGEAVVRSWPRADVDAVLLMSSEVARVVSRYAVDGLPGWHDILELVAVDGVQALVDHVHAVEETDSDRRRWPRGRTHEDKAAALVMTETYEAGTRMGSLFSSLAAADRAMERGAHDTAYELYTSLCAAFASAVEQDPSDNDQHSGLHSARLRRCDALARAGRLDELAALATTDIQALRRLDVHLHDEGRADELRVRAVNGDEYALYLLIRLLRAWGDDAAARRAVEDIAPDNDYGRKLANEP